MSHMVFARRESKSEVGKMNYDYESEIGWSETNLGVAHGLSGKVAQKLADWEEVPVELKSELHGRLNDYADYRNKGHVQPNVLVDSGAFTTGDNLFLDLVAFFDRSFGFGSYKGLELMEKKKRKRA